MKILIVDDSRPLQKRFMESFLAVDSLTEIYQAFSCKEAIEFFSSSQPEIVILDLELPDGSGITLLRKFKEDRPGVKVIITEEQTEIKSN